MTTTELNDLISKAMIDLLYLHTTIGSVVINCKGVQVTENKDIPAIAYTDGKGIYINQYFLNTVYSKKYPPLTCQNLMFIIAHEASHLMTLTLNRLSNKNTLLWNMASDYAINSLLINNHVNGIELPVGTPIKDIYYDPKYIDMSADEIYNDLLNNYTEKDSPAQSILDYHMPIDDNTVESIQCRVDEILSQHDFSKSNSSIERLLQLRPKTPFPWRKILSNFISDYIKEDYTWRLPSKISLATGFYLPSEDKLPTIKVAVGIDTSGSISDKDLNLFFSHLSNILSSFEQLTLEIHCFSTKVHTKTIKTVTEKDIHTNFFSNYKTESWGGTSIESSFNYISEHETDFDVYICMTDGIDDISNLTFNKTKVIWCITNNPNHTFTNPKGVQNSTIIYLDNPD